MQFRKICFTLIVLSLCAAFASSAFSQTDEEAEIFELVNRERAKSRLAPLEWDDRLGKMARLYSLKMARERFFSHYDSNGSSVAERSSQAGAGNWRKIGENLFMIGSHPQFTVPSVRGWMRSTSHRRNIQDRAWTATGVGVAQSRDGHIYVTQVFVRR